MGSLDYRKGEPRLDLVNAANSIRAIAEQIRVDAQREDNPMRRAVLEKFCSDLNKSLVNLKN